LAVTGLKTSKPYSSRKIHPLLVMSMVVPLRAHDVLCPVFLSLTVVELAAMQRLSKQENLDAALADRLLALTVGRRNLAPI
jgi:hypothetical protein